MRRRRRRSLVHLQPLPKRPFRDSAIFYGALSLALVLLAYLTGGDIRRAFLFGLGFFLVATAWTWWKFRVRLQEERTRS